MRERGPTTRGTTGPPTVSSNVDIADDAVPLVDAWAEALGGRDAIARLGEVHMKGTCTIQSRDCTFESFMSPKGEIWYGVTFQDGAIVVGYDGTSAWRQEGESVTELTGTDLEDLLRPGLLESYSMVFPDRHHGTIKLAGASGLEILPRAVSVPIVVRFRSDGLPVSDEAPGFRVVFQGWNEYLGVQIVQAWTSGATGTENSFRLSRVDGEHGTYAKPSH
jgi:hypothetical protein